VAARLGQSSGVITMVSMSIKSRYNNGLIVKIVSIFADVEEREEKRKESLALMQVTSWARNHRHLWAQTKMYVRRNMKEKVRYATT
jgi:hypothetical protein